VSVVVAFSVGSVPGHPRDDDRARCAADDVSRRPAEQHLAKPAAAFDADDDRLRVVLERDTSSLRP